jgi:Ser/Thr protein kinase RdoA (MazF antagonist)
MKQLRRRLEDIYKVHPEFQVPHHRIGQVEARSFEELIDRAEKIDSKMKAPFRVLIHGDFNTDNVIINTERKEIHFIDLHRSKPSDYVQDVSTFLLSNFRIPVFEPALRARLDRVNEEFLHFAREFAARNEDESFEIRLALGLARSFTTSTRFQLDEEFSQAMFMRGVYLLERLLDHEGRPWGDFRVNDEVLVY